MMRLLYSVIYALVLPVIFPGQYKKRPADLRPLWLRQKLGRLKPRTDDTPLLWVHAVSVGETATAATFINSFMKSHPEYRVVISTVTDTGRKVAIDRLGGRAEVIYLPFDLPVFIKSAIRALRPSVFVVMETEIWPNLFHCMSSSGVPVAMLNGRISKKSFNSYLKLKFALKPVLANVSAFSMQSPTYAERIIRMGAEPSRVRVDGNLKFDIKLDRKVIQWTRGLSGPIVVAGSTHRGEEELMAGVFKSILSRRAVSLILAPRHPERTQEVEGVLRSHGLTCLKRSEIKNSEPSTADVVLVDTVGELTSIYSEADISIIGGSFIPHGGQNPLEPAYWGKPVICGPNMWNFPFIDEFYKAGAAVEANESNLMEIVEGLLDSPQRCKRMGQQAYEIVERNRGAVGQALQTVETLLLEV